MAVKSKHGAGGEYSPDWRPSNLKVGVALLYPLLCGRLQTVHLKAVEAPPDPVATPAPGPGPSPEEPIQARPGWRVIHKRKPKAITAGPGAPPPAPAPVPVASPPPARQELPAWAQWRRTYSFDMQGLHETDVVDPAWLANPLLAPTPVAAVIPQSPPPKPGLFGAQCFHPFLPVP